MKSVKIVVLFFLITALAQAQSLKEGIQSRDREQYQKAKSILTALVTTEPKNTDNFYYLGDVYFKNEQYDSARYWFMKGITQNDNSALNYAGLGKVSMQNNNAVEGKANFDKAVSIAKKDGQVYAVIAEYYLLLDKPDGKEALVYATKGVGIDPKNSWAKLMLGDAQMIALADGPSKAILQYKEAFALDPKSPLALWKMGKLYLSARNYELGIQTFKDGLAIDSLFAPIYRDLGELYYKAKKFDKAIVSYKKYLDIRDKSDGTDFRYASFLYLNEDYANALTILNTLVKKNYDNPVIYRIMAKSQYETKDYKNALINMDIFWSKVEARKIISQDYEYYGKILSKNGKDSLAVEYLCKALEKDSMNKELYGEVALIWSNLKKFDKSTVALQKKIDIIKVSGKANPTTLANEYLLLGRTYMYAKNYLYADSLAFANVVLLKPELPVGYYKRAWANTFIDTNQKKGLAKPYYEKFIELAKTDSEKNKADLIQAYSYMGAYYADKRDKVKFDEAWANVLKLDPKNKEGLRAVSSTW